MKKKTFKSLSLKKSSVANISGGAQDAQAQQAQNDVSAVACPNPTIILTVHSILPWDCETVSCYTKCDWCDFV